MLRGMMSRPIQTTYDFGTIATCAVPHTDGRAGANRPCVVLSCADHNRRSRDVVIAPVTSQMWQRRTPNAVVLENWQAAGLDQPSVVKPILMSVEAIQLGPAIGKLVGRDRAAVKVAIAAVLGFRRDPRR